MLILFKENVYLHDKEKQTTIRIHLESTFLAAWEI